MGTIRIGLDNESTRLIDDTGVVSRQIHHCGHDDYELSFTRRLFGHYVEPVCEHDTVLVSVNIRL